MNFKIGDKVIGIPNNGYGVTSDLCVLEVTDIEEIDGSQYFTGKMVGHKEKKYKSSIGTEYATLPTNMFKIPTQEEVNEILYVADKDVKVKPAEEYKLRSNLVIKAYEDGKIESTFNKGRELLVEYQEDRISALRKIMDTLKSKNKAEVFSYNIAQLGDMKEFKCFDDIFSEKARVKALEDFINFFVEFQFEPSLRFINTLALKLAQDLTSGKNYITNYFKLSNSPYITGIEDKLKSQECKELLYSIGVSDPKDVVNTRLKVYFGSPGTGKTYRSMEETDGRVVICNSSLLPSDLIEDFNFIDGKPGFTKSALRHCMENGLPITFDEANLLNFECLRFLQGILDGKSQFTYKGESIKIKDGFKVIFTLNLSVNGNVYGLPEPLVDRCSDIVEFKLTGKDLMRALL